MLASKKKFVKKQKKSEQNNWKLVAELTIPVGANVSIDPSGSLMVLSENADDVRLSEKSQQKSELQNMFDKYIKLDKNLSHIEFKKFALSWHKYKDAFKLVGYDTILKTLVL